MIPLRHSQEESRYFGWIAALPCIVSGARPVQVAHIRGADALWEKELPGMGRKPSIPYVVPLTHRLHLEQEAGNWRFWTKHGMDRSPAQSSILFHCWFLWSVYFLEPSSRLEGSGQLLAERYITRLIAERGG